MELTLRTEFDDILSRIWGENQDSQLKMKSIWSINTEDKRNPRQPGKEILPAVPQAPTISQQVAKGGRLYMDQVFNQLEELELERRSNEAELGIPSKPFTATRRGQFDWDGLSLMLLETRKQFGLLKNFAQIVEGMRLDAESKATSLSPIDKHALFLELFVDKEEGVAARQKFSNAEDRLYEDFESKMSAINRILFPLNTGLVEKSTVKLDVVPYLLKELAEIIRVSRIFLFAVRYRYDEVIQRCSC